MVIRLLFILSVVVLATATLQSILNCMSRGYVTPLGDENSPFYIYKNLRLLSCRSSPLSPSNNCTWAESGGIYATLFTYSNNQLLTATTPIRQLDIEKWELISDLTIPGKVTRVYANLFPTTAKIAYYRLTGQCY